jgi:hypothetical protein
MRAATRSNQSIVRLLVVGDVLALVLWVIVGRLSHNQTTGWLSNIVRIAAPFLIGWAVATLFVGPYDLGLLRRPLAFMGRSVLGWLIAVGIGLLLRATLFGDGFVPVFAAVTLGVTGVFLLGWRGVFIWLWRETT